MWTVNSLGDSGTGSGQSGDLRYVINRVDRTPGDNTVNFSVTGTIMLGSPLPDLSNTTGLTDIEGPGANNLKVSGNGVVRVLQVDSGVTAKLAGLTVTGGFVFDNSGGGILNYGTVTITRCAISNNSAVGSYPSSIGGGIYNGGTMTLADSTIDYNTIGAGFGGGICNAGTMTVVNSIIDYNSTGIDLGGGIYNGGTMTLANSTIDNNSAGDIGGGIYSAGTLSVADCTVDNNQGGGISNGGTLTVANSTIDNNSDGGIGNGGTLTAVNDTIAYNNLAGSGGGVDVSSGTATMDNTIVALNTQGTGSGALASDIHGMVSGQYNLIGTGGSGGLVNGDNGNQVGVANPRLGPLADNGGPTQTIALLAGSPAIDAASNALAVDPTTGLPLTTDQRGHGFARIVKGTADIGAFEVQPTNHLVVTAQPPGSVTAGSGFGFTVKAEDQSGSVISSFDGTVTVALWNNPGGATLGGTLTVTAHNGVAAFSGLTLDKAGTGCTLFVSANGLAGADTSPSNVNPASATHLAVITPPLPRVTAGSGFGLVAVAEDPFGNVDTSFAGSVAVALVNNPGGATLGGAPSVTAQNGVAAFSGLTLDKAGTGYTLLVSANGLAGADTSTFDVALQWMWTVNGLGDAGTGSGQSGDLRYVITQVDQTSGDNTINFSVTGTITLNSALPYLSNTTGLTVIEGPGAANLTVARSSDAGTPSFSVFTVDANVQATLVGLTITGGSAVVGGGIWNAGTLTATNSTIAGNSAYESGGGIEDSGTLTVTNSTIAGNTAWNAGGGGIDNVGTLTATNSTIAGNSAGNGLNIMAGNGGGIDNEGGVLVLVNSQVSGNRVISGSPFPSTGGGIHSSGTTIVVGCSITANQAQAYPYYYYPRYGRPGDSMGGGLYIDSGSVELTDSTIQGNSAIGSEGYTYSILPGGSALGGGIYLANATATITDVTISGNSALGGYVGPYYSELLPPALVPGGAALGGGIYLADTTASITGATISGNSAVGGYGGDVIVVDPDLYGNPHPVPGSGGSAQGGGIYLANATASITAATISGNSVAGGDGGSVWFLFFPNPFEAPTYFFGGDGGEADGGGVYLGGSSGSPVLVNDTIADNSAVGGTAVSGFTSFGFVGEPTVSTPPPGAMLDWGVNDGYGGASFGGGIASAAGSSSVTIVNNTVVDNSSQGGLGGGYGGVYVYGVGNIGAFGVPDSPASGYGGGLGIQSGTATLDNTIVAQNSDDIGGSAVSGAYNLIGTGGSGGLVNGQNGNLVGVVNPGLDPNGLQNNGGPTQTIALVTGSPAIDAGSNALAVDPQGNPLATDQRGLGFSRFANGTVDIGAYEVQSYVTGAVTVGWGTKTVALQTASDGQRLLPAGRNTDLPWVGLNQVQINLTQAEPLSAADVTITSAIGANYGPLTVSGSGTSYIITLTKPISAADRVTITIGNSLIARFTRRLDVLPGDVNDDGVVNTTDGVLILQNPTPGHAYNNIYDMNGDGAVNTTDFNLYRPRIGTVLPGLSPQLASGAVVPGGAAPLTLSQVTPVFQTAISQWAAAGLHAQYVARLRSVSIQVVDLPPGYLAEPPSAVPRSTCPRLQPDTAGSSTRQLQPMPRSPGLSRRPVWRPVWPQYLVRLGRF